ncbi:MAG: peptidyl-prolyl cis-trans isomerase [Firmicutes bacterium]|nr:peptidyl-prolyl cis-trans isomerase [Bacillota bacterium]
MARKNVTGSGRGARGNRVLVLILVASIGVAGMATALAAVVLSPEAAAVVNGKVITRDQLYREMYIRVGEDVLEEMIDAVLVQEEARRQGVVVSDEEVRQEVDRMIQEQYSSEQAFLETLDYYGMTRVDVEAQWRVYLAARKMLLPQIQVGDDEIESYFEAHRDEFDEQEAVRLRHILAGSEEEARQILAELRAGADFAALARERSLDKATASEGGDMGLVGRGQLPPELEDMAFTLPVGEWSDPVEAADGFHILQVLERREAREVSLEEVRDRVVERLQEEKLAEMYPEWLSSLRAAARIEYRPPR